MEKQTYTVPELFAQKWIPRTFCLVSAVLVTRIVVALSDTDSIADPTKATSWELVLGTVWLSSFASLWYCVFSRKDDD